MTCVNSVSVYPKSITLKKGNWYYGAYAEVCPCEADCKEVVWHSNNPSVASVNASRGYIYANSAGTAKIYATATDGSGCSDYLTVTVKEIVKVTSVSLNRSSLLIEKGKYRTLTATVLPTNAENKALIWRSDKPCFASVCNGIVYAVSKGTATITATATDGSGKYATCTVSVTEDVLVTSISVTSTQSLKVGDSAYLSATVLPTNATNKAVLWTSDNTEVASVNANSGLVYANAVGTAKITATARDGSGVYGTINISVSPVPVTSVTVSPKEKTLSVGETTTLSATVSPSNATDKSVIWTSSDTSVATVGKYTGVVTAKADGTATITAKSVDGNKTDTCTITVDSREIVTIKKDSHSFYVEFADGKVWKNIGIDLSKREENYDSMYPPNMWFEYYDDLIPEEQRYFDNTYALKDGYWSACNTYTVKQLAYLYLFDPLGVEYYMRNHAHKVIDGSSTLLEFKDAVYEAIFGNTDKRLGRFYFKIVNGHTQYGKYDENQNFDRWYVYSNAEILFGEHAYFDWGDFVLSGLESIFGMVPVISNILLGVEMYQALFFSGSIVGATSSAASHFLEKYAEESGDTVLNRFFGWPKKVFDCFSAIADAVIGAFQLNDLNDMTIYSKVQEQDYRTFFESDASELSIEEIISMCSNN